MVKFLSFRILLEFLLHVLKVESYKCGQLVAEVFRDVNVALISCGTLPNGAQNSPPVITAPVGPQNWITNLNPSTGLPSYEDYRNGR